MKPIAQTFIANEPTTGVEAIFLTQIDLYFQSKSSVYGVEVQIRETLNGAPTVNRLPYASKILQSSSVSISSDGSVATSFVFDTPVVLRTNEQFAIVVVPVGGNPDYNIWTAELGQNDANSGVPIFTNNQLGSLFISSNDLNFTPIQNESMKYTLYTAQFSATSATAVFRNSNTDFFSVKDQIGVFSPGEQVVISNSNITLAAMSITTGTAFTSNEIVFQPNTATKQTATAYGTVIQSNTVYVLLTNTYGSFTTSGGGLKGVTSGIMTANPTVVNANLVTVSTPGASNKITVPSVNTTAITDFTSGNFLYVGSGTHTNTTIVQITNVDPSSNTLTLSANLTFDTTNAFVGRVKEDANLYGYFSSRSKNDKGILMLDQVTSNAAANFANSNGKYLIGRSTGASVTIDKIVDFYYESITAQYSAISPKQTALGFSFQGISNTKTQDSSGASIVTEVPYEFIDEQRMIMSRSNEWKNKIGSTAGTNSLTVQVGLGTSNNSISPYIDTVRNVVTLTHNKTLDPTNHNGYYFGIANTTGIFNVGEILTQANPEGTANTLGTVIFANTTFVVVSNATSSNSAVIDSFNANGTSFVISTTNSAMLANVSSVVSFTEAKGNGIETSRYISKNVILADGQDAEDLVCYLGAYRPPGTNFKVYGKFLNASDNDAYESKVWSILSEISSPAIQSSLVNKNDFVELVYELPLSTNVYSYGAICNTTSPNVTVPTTGTTASFTPGQYFYMADISYGVATASIDVAGTGYANGDVIQLSGTPGYVNSSFSVTTNSGGGVVALVVTNQGSYTTNTAITANTTTATIGTGSGLKITVTGSAFTQSTKFGVRQITNIANTTTLILSSNGAFASGNVAIGIVPTNSQYSAFRYSRNNNVARYVTPTDGIYDSYKTFAVKLVPTTTSSQIVPRLTDMRCLALQV
jgi:hypothetical protein